MRWLYDVFLVQLANRRAAPKRQLGRRVRQCDPLAGAVSHRHLARLEGGAMIHRAAVLRVLVFLNAWAAGLLPVYAGEGDATLAMRVIILANTEDPESLRIARHYADVRRVPA